MNEVDCNFMTEERRSKLEAVLAKRQTDLVVVLENVFDPHNISAIMRSCDAVGIQDIYVLNTKIPRHADWGFKSSRSAIKWINAHQYSDANVLFSYLKEKGFSIYSTALTPGAKNLFTVNLTQKMALVFGNEQNGVSEEIRKLCEGDIFIPQVGMIASLNVSVACAVALYEAYRQKNVAGHYLHMKLTTDEHLQLQKQWGLKD